MKYAIESLEIELHRLKGVMRNLDTMQDEMYQNHPSLDSYKKKSEEIKSAIKLLINGR